MSFNKSILAFDDIREIFDKALLSTRGIRITCESRKAAFILRSRFNYFRKLHRKWSLTVYDKDHMMYGNSPYDRLVLRIPPKFTHEENVLYIEPHIIPETILVEEIT